MPDRLTLPKDYTFKTLKVRRDRAVTPRVAEAIRDRYQSGESVASLAEDFIFSRSIIRRIVLTDKD